jgi:hypothetical protein
MLLSRCQIAGQNSKHIGWKRVTVQIFGNYSNKYTEN